MSFLDLFDTTGSRQKFAGTMQAELLKANGGDESSRDKIIEGARHRIGFRSCYALHTLAELKFPTEATMLVQIERMKSEDPFVRNSAAQSIVRTMDVQGVQPFDKVRTELVSSLNQILRSNFNEGAGLYAMMALGKLKDGSPETIENLKNAATMTNSMNRTLAQELLEQLSH